MFANAKGGAGKSTLLVGIAGELAVRGYKVKIIDTDNPSHLLNWKSVSKANMNWIENIEVVSARTTEGVKSALQYESENEVILLDTPGRDISIIEAAMPLIDCIISPIFPSIPDLVGSQEISKRLKSFAGKINLPLMLLVVTRWTTTDKSNPINIPMEAYAKDHGLKILDTKIWRRACMIEAFSGAGPIQTYTKAKSAMPYIEAARTEFRVLTDEIINQLSAHIGRLS
jgi:chromosome partitioning protein